MYDYLIVGSGLFGASCAYLLHKKGKKVLVIEKKDVVGGGIRTERKDGIDVHIYGPHIFHTSDKEVWDFVNQFVTMNDFINCPIANFHGKLFHLPFNMNTFVDMWGISDPEVAKKKIQSQIEESGIKEPKNLEEQAISMVGTDIYKTLVKGYTEKQWGRPCKELPKEIIKRLPVRFTFNNNYFNDTYQGVPKEGYTALIEKLLEGVEVRTSTDYFQEEEHFRHLASKMIFTGMIDQFYHLQLGKLDYRTLRFETERLEQRDFQGNAVINYTDSETPYTRIVEHKHFNMVDSPVTYITKEYSKEYVEGDEAFYPVNNERNSTLYKAYLELSKKDPDVYFAGRLGMYQYFDMDDTILAAMKLIERIEG